MMITVTVERDYEIFQGREEFALELFLNKIMEETNGINWNQTINFLSNMEKVFYKDFVNPGQMIWV